MVIYAIFADLGWRIIAGMVGLYILSEGSGLTHALKKSFKEGKKGLEFGKLSPIGNIVSILVILIGILYAYNVSYHLEFIQSVGSFIYNFANPLALGLLIYITVHFIDDIIYTNKEMLKLLKGFFFKIIVIFMSREILFEFSKFLGGKVSFTTVIVYVIVYIALLIILSSILFYKQNKDNLHKIVDNYYRVEFDNTKLIKNKEIPNEIRELKEKEEKELTSWEEEIEKIKSQIQRVDDDVFSKIE